MTRTREDVAKREGTKEIIPKLRRTKRERRQATRFSSGTT
jgi:hypothetical protein